MCAGILAHVYLRGKQQGKAVRQQTPPPRTTGVGPVGAQWHHGPWLRTIIVAEPRERATESHVALR